MGGGKEDASAQRAALPWQDRALTYVDQIPELNYASRFYARMLRQLRLYPAILDENDQPVPVEDATAVEILNRIRDPGGGRSQILGMYGRLAFVTGEGVLFGRHLETPDEVWQYVWTKELDIEVDSSTKHVKKITHRPNGSQQGSVAYGPSEAVAYRMWTPHPRSSGEADSPMRSALDVAEELILLTLAVRATAVSRTTQGLLFLPLEAAPPPAEAGGDEDPHSDPWMDDLVEHLVAQKENAGTAEAAAPFVSWIPAEFINTAVQFVHLHDTQNDYAERELRKEAVERLARGLDFPPEALLGLGNSNHWAAMQILSDMWRSHGVGIADQFRHDLNQAYYRPALKEAGVAQADEIVIAMDASNVIVKNELSDDADKAMDRGAISYTGYRALKNIPEKWKATPGDIEQMLEAKGKTSSPDPSPSLPAAEPPPPGPEGDSGRKTRVVASASREFGAAEMALHRCREIAGNRIRNKGKGKISLREDVPAERAAFSLGTSVVAGLHVPARELVAGGTDSLLGLLEGWGYSHAEAASICETVELFAARTLFEEVASLPSALESRFAQSRDLIEAS